MAARDTQPYIKWLTPEGKPVHGGSGRWPLPTQRPDGSWIPGAPIRVEGPLVPCRRGLHLCRLADAAQWIAEGAVPFLVQYRGELVEAADKVVVREAWLVRRLAWDDRLARHFACDCAERALTHIPAPDSRSVAAIAVARRFADGHATRDELSAARAAAWAATRDELSAARAVAWAVAWAAARDAAWAAAWAAARAAAWAAARDAAWDAERAWIGQRLWHYFTGGQPDGRDA